MCLKNILPLDCLVFRKLKGTGQKVGAAAALCHIKKVWDGINTHHILNVANVGDTEVIISRSREAVPLSRLFIIQSDKEECQRICRSDGIITEVGDIDYRDSYGVLSRSFIPRAGEVHK